ncbi:MAG: cytochrome c, partial [Gammaproteobacteria bacterium]|nr:cytochrome c [Gammaproteobacteria bacterium]
MQRGREVFDQRCAACHGEIPEQTFGPPFLPPMPGTQALEARYRGALPAALEERTDLAPEYVEAVVRDGLRSMPFFRPTELSDEDLEALVAYLTADRSTPAAGAAAADRSTPAAGAAAA